MKTHITDRVCKDPAALSLCGFFQEREGPLLLEDTKKPASQRRRHFFAVKGGFLMKGAPERYRDG